MESVKSRSESPLSKNKSQIQIQLSDISENKEGAIEQVKAKKKRLRNKHKSEVNGKENENSEKNGNDFYKEDLLVSNSTERADDDKENDQDIENNNENLNQLSEEINTKDKNETLINVCEEKVEKIENNCNGKHENGDNPEESRSSIEPTTSKCDVETENTEKSGNNSTNEKINNAKKDISTENYVASANGVDAEIYVEKSNGEVNDFNNVPLKECNLVEETSENGFNGSDNGSHYEDAHTTKKDGIQDSPDLKDDSFFSNKFSNFLGKWNSTPTKEERTHHKAQEEKKENEITSSNKVSELQQKDEEVLLHPYFSKVSGRRGIRDRMNSSLISFNSDIDEVKTPKNSPDTLNDSFRVRTNPPRLNSSEVQENPTLRKFKGKRCLNANDEPEDEDDDICMAATKRQKLDSKCHQSGLLGNILWSPFQKKPVENANPLKSANAESKLSRFLSPFWFWKKTTEGQKGK